MRCLSVLVFALLLAACWPAAAEAPAQDFVTFALHDVVDDPGELDAEAVTTDRLVAFFDWLAGNDFHPISLDDVERARRGERPLPARAVLLTVDDGLRSLYTRVYPLAVAYRFPVVAALVGEWMDVPAGGLVSYGDARLPRDRFVTWDEAREMQASGWVEFASHSQALHQFVPANPQGNLLPATVTRRYLGNGNYESEPAWRERIEADLRQSRARMASELGRPPRALAWPYGRPSAQARAVAAAVGFEYAMTLDAGPASTDRPFEISRFPPGGNPSLGNWVAALAQRDPWPAARRLVCVDPAAFASADPEQTNERLGHAIERLNALGATDVVIDAIARGPDGRIVASWFPTTLLPLRADLLSRLASQMRARGGVNVALRLPHAAALAALGDPARVLQLYDELGALVAFDALLVEDAPSFGRDARPAPQMPWDLAAARRTQDASAWPAADALALQAFRTAQRRRPGLELFWLADAGWAPGRLAPLADLTLLSTPLGENLALPATMRPPASRRFAVWWQGAVPDADRIAVAMRRLQVLGVTGFGWCPDDPLADVPAAARVAPAWSARAFPLQGVQP